METKRGLLFFFVVGFLFVSAFSLVFAAQVGKNLTGMNETARQEKNMTYGQCVSENAAIKNDCFASSRSTYSSCRNSTSDRKDCAKSFRMERT